MRTATAVRYLQVPRLRPDVIAFLEHGVYATANMRGGGEYGEAWHEAGMFEKAERLDDFIAAAQAGSRNNTRPQPRSASWALERGPLVGAAMQRPDLFAAALPVVGVMDMLRYHKLPADLRGRRIRSSDDA
jgi:prolyl oligopeptidase